jgi:hypothetical protein
MTPYQQNQRSNGGGAAAPQRDKVTFAINVPQVLTLEFNPPTDAREGRFGDQFMYFLGENKILWADPPLHEEILRSGAKAGSEIGICKRELRNAGRRHIQWEVGVVEDEPAQPPTAVARPAIVSRPRATAPPPIRAGSEHIAGNLMAAALQQAIEACELSGFDARPEDIRALAITIYIHATGGKK